MNIGDKEMQRLKSMKNELDAVHGLDRNEYNRGVIDGLEMAIASIEERTANLVAAD